MKRVLLQLLCLLLFGISKANAQYYLDETGNHTTDMNKAYYSRKVTPEFKDGKQQYIVLEKFVSNDKVKTSGISLSGKAPYNYIGHKETYYPDGMPKSKETFNTKGYLIDTAYYYYPSGKIHLITLNNGTNNITWQYNSTTQYLAYFDSLGIRKIENGNGIIHFKTGFKNDFEEGPLVNNKREGEWQGKSTDIIPHTFKEYYKDDNLLYGEMTKNDGTISRYDSTNYNIDPTYSEGIGKLMQFISNNYNCPSKALKAGASGTILIGFFIEKDGSLSDFRIFQDLGFGTGDAGIAVIKKSKKWIPRVYKGESVRVAYMLPIRLNLQKD
jgi:hypothetical protein